VEKLYQKNMQIWFGTKQIEDRPE